MSEDDFIEEAKVMTWVNTQLETFHSSFEQSVEY